MRLKYILENQKFMKSVYYTRFVKFINKYPSAYDLLINHKGDLKSLYALFIQNEILKNGKPYSISSVHSYLMFLKDIREIDGEIGSGPSNSFDFKSQKRGYATSSRVENKDLVTVELGYGSDSKFFSTLLGEELKKIIYSLNEGTYKINFSICWENNFGRVEGGSLGAGIFINNEINVDSLIRLVEKAYNDVVSGYGLADATVKLVCRYRPWSLDYNNSLTKEELTKKFNSLITHELGENESLEKRLKDFENREFRDIYINNYGVFLEEILLNDENYKVYQISRTEKVAVKTTYDLIYVYSLIGGNTLNLKWVDKLTSTGFNRVMGNLIYYYDEKGYTHCEYKYIGKPFPMEKKATEEKLNIGSFDLETYLDADNKFVVYAAGFAIKNFTQMVYAKDEMESSNDICNKVLEAIFALDLDNCIFYCHNLGKFDAIFLMKALSSNENYEFNGIWRGETTSLLSITIKNKLTKQKIKINDSLYLLNASLDDLLKAFNCQNNKGIFPYNFMNKDRLFYTGVKPSKKYYSKISRETYNSIPSKNWNAKLETLKYLKQDLEGLLELMLKFASHIFFDFNINIVDYYTLPSLAMAIYTTHFIDKNKLEQLKILPRIVQSDIRHSYFGGHSFILRNRVENVKSYDMNSQYPSAMLKDMPVGDPIFSTDKNLDNYFGFVFGVITPPPNNKILQSKVNGMNTYPSDSFTRWISTEEIKECIKQGASFKLICGYKFEKGKDLFKSYVEKFYADKMNASNPIIATIAKLFLNTLYGKFGQNIPIVQIRLVKDINLNYYSSSNIDIITSFNQQTLIKDYGLLPEFLRNSQQFVKKHVAVPNKNETLFHSYNYCVHIASAIAAEARISMIPLLLSDKLIAVNTDGVMLENEMDNTLIGKKIGQFKLVYSIQEAIIINPLLQYIRTNDNQEIIKSAGIHNELLNKEIFIKLLKGETVEITMSKFGINIKEQTITYSPFTIHLKK